VDGSERSPRRDPSAVRRFDWLTAGKLTAGKLRTGQDRSGQVRRGYEDEDEDTEVISPQQLNPSTELRAGNSTTAPLIPLSLRHALKNEKRPI
jgi:hypothetical protein